MNQTETTTLITYLNRAGLVGALEGQVAVWSDALDDMPFEFAQMAARWFAKNRLSTERWLTPGDVRRRGFEFRREVGDKRWSALPSELREPRIPEEIEQYSARAAHLTNKYEMGVRGGLTPEAAWDEACRYVELPVTPLVTGEAGKVYISAGRNHF